MRGTSKVQVLKVMKLLALWWWDELLAPIKEDAIRSPMPEIQVLASFDPSALL